MPTINDATVVNSAYDTSGNGGRKLVKLDNGNQYSAMKTGTGWYVYKTTNNWSTKTSVAEESSLTSVQDISLTTNGVNIYILINMNNGAVQFRSYKDSGTIIGSIVNIDTVTALGNVSLITNEERTELHATWSSKNATYPNSFNIRYAKGTINGDGSVTWGAIVQVTKRNNSGYDYTNPSIVFHSNGHPFIFSEVISSTTRLIMVLTTSFTTVAWDASLIDTAWGNKVIHNGGTYAQSSPSAMFVLQSVNGLANGRIWVAWHGTDATESNFTNIRSSYSDDGGVTWSAMSKLTNGNTIGNYSPSLTANKQNEVFVLYYYNSATWEIRKLKHNGTSWGSFSTVNANKGSAPSTLYDPTFNFTEPLFIYKNDSTTPHVGFYGTWTVTTISVTQGSIGTKTDKSNVLTYAITTDGTMSTITEKVNGVTVGTKTATSGQSLIAGLTQAQWDAVKFGKYADVTGGKNTLTVEMGMEKWTYTFDRRLATTDDILSAVKAEQDVSNVFLPAVKSKLASAITSRGGTATGTDTWDALEDAIGGIGSKKWASGTSTTFNQIIDVKGLSFAPSLVVARNMDNTNSSSNYADSVVVYALSGVFNSVGDVAFRIYATNNVVGGTWNKRTDGFFITTSSNGSFKWLAIE